ncbi:MAG TPA: hypothetical protein VH934_01450 [Xanthobacteraceae bacterium]|jgi:hypothetical protein
MANDLTGEFDIAVQMPMQAMNRVFAAMHRGRRFPHSLSVRVDDKQPIATQGLVVRPISARVDRYGEALADWHRIRPGGELPFPMPSEHVVFDPVVNRILPTREAAVRVHSNLEGIAQLQVSAPTMGIPDDSGVNVSGAVQVMVRYIADAGTRDIPQFMRGEIDIAARIDQVASQAGNVIDVDLKADTVDVRFKPAWSDRALQSSDIKSIEQAIRNALKTAFQPSNAMLPGSVQAMQFKTYKSPPGGIDAIAVLLNTTDRGGDPASANRLLLGGDDHFAYAAGKDFVIGAFDRMIAAALDQLNLRTFDYSFDLVTRIAGYVITRTAIRYTVTLGSVRLELQTGQMHLTIEGAARTASVLPNFAFRMTQALTLQLAGAQAELATVGDVSLTITSGGIQGWIVNLFKGSAVGGIRSIRNQAIARAQPGVRALLDANTSLGAFLTSIMNPVGASGALPEHLEPALEYTAFDITPDGLILHGALAVPVWPPAQVELDATPGTGSAAHDYTALLSWIPGGTIRQYAWRYSGQAQPFQVDGNTFVTVDPPDAPTPSLLSPVYGYVPICLALSGDRCSASGPVALETVEATTCGWSAIPLFKPTRVSSDGRLHIVLARPGRGGLVEVAGHAAPMADESGADALNIVVHFAGEDASADSERILHAVREAGRRDAGIAVLVVLPADQLTLTRYTEGVIYAEDQGAWSHALGVELGRRPTTVFVDPSGKAVWRHEGAVSGDELAVVLRERARPTPIRLPELLRTKLRLGHPPPNFVFSYAPGRELTLRKLVGRAVTLVFWQSRLAPSVETVREIQAASLQDDAHPLVVAIHDGGSADAVLSVLDRERAWPVEDDDQALALAYGINVWPTIVSVDAAGLVRDVRYGRQGPMLHSLKGQAR